MASENSVNNYILSKTDENGVYDDYSDADSSSYFRNLNLRYFAVKPLRMLSENKWLKEKCLKNDNPEAHYIEGILQYFVQNDKPTGIFHLKESAVARYQNGMYLYGLLMIASGHYRTGKKWMDKLEWEKNLSTSDHCWERIKNSLSAIHVKITRRFYVNMVNLEPRTYCDLDNYEKVCQECYYFKRLKVIL